MSDRPTPETDAACWRSRLQGHGTVDDCDPELCHADFARKLECERDEAREMQAKALRERESTEREVDAMLERAIKAEQERDEAREELQKTRKFLRDANLGAEINARINNSLAGELIELRRERDEARKALMEIEDRCVDCEDACDDIQKIREIAVKALEGAK